jgi:hypothetical protein
MRQINHKIWCQITRKDIIGEGLHGRAGAAAGLHHVVDHLRIHPSFHTQEHAFIGGGVDKGEPVVAQFHDTTAAAVANVEPMGVNGQQQGFAGGERRRDTLPMTASVSRAAPATPPLTGASSMVTPLAARAA